MTDLETRLERVLQIADRKTTAPPRSTLKAKVTERHQRVTKLRAEGLTWPQISERLGITERQASWAAKTEEERRALGKHEADCPACARGES